jgi:hypothetical protein
MLRTFSDNPTCKHIIFGGCHDNGYLLDLDQYKHNQAKAARFTLLETTPAERGFADLPNFQRARFEEVFRSEPLPASASQYQQYPTQSYTQSPMQQTPFTAPQATSRTMSNKLPSPVSSPPPIERPTPLPTPSESSPSTTSASLSGQQNGDSWATVGKNGAFDSSISIASNKASAKNKKYVYYNREGFRLDEPLPPRDRQAGEAIEERMIKVSLSCPYI